MSFKFRPNQGIGLVEVLIVVAIIGLALASLAGLGNYSLRLQGQLKKNVAATFLASEALEATRAIKDGNWNTLLTYLNETPLHPAKNGSSTAWSLINGAETIDSFQRQVVIGIVRRDSNFNIVSEGGTVDDDTKKITATVSWTENNQTQRVILTSHLTNWKP